MCCSRETCTFAIGCGSLYWGLYNYGLLTLFQHNYYINYMQRFLYLVGSVNYSASGGGENEGPYHVHSERLPGARTGRNQQLPF